jgi:lysophospholipase L1-like esterase
MEMDTNERLSKKKRVIFTLVIILSALTLLESGARLHDYFRPNRMESYKRLSANATLGYELIPNYRALTPNGKREAIVINSLGYRGPEFEPDKPSGTTRILCLGDSCTFEGIPENAPYPRRLEVLLNETYPETRFEVINGAVEGYDSTKALERLKAALSYHPDFVTIYIGWNDLYNTDPEQAASNQGSSIIAPLLRHSRFVSKVRGLFFLKLRPKWKTREPLKAELYKQFSPLRYEANLREMIALVRSRNARPFLITLPSLLSPHISDAALERAQFPYHTNSVADMIVLTERYNQSIRQVAAETETALIDLAAEFEKLPDKEKFFSDTIHMYNDAKPMVAIAIKDALQKN